MWKIIKYLIICFIGFLVIFIGSLILAELLIDDINDLQYWIRNKINNYD